ncbi:heparinase II/III family protein [Ruficoccus sp. ZRK36]|uniref:heparinase II/III domain-containing protein n=1 Tax=Ruficoccus sp. ZRK36 TaxID=2866311 RepID=UPI001C72CAEB|nr:heparinase II/III family protein [Ruficoccus sp. ZRK36]QYY35076.1 heparinase II/III-family protein [Ruficoccus sp. ZRK36]
MATPTATTTDAAVAQPVENREHPRLLLTDQRVEEIRQLAKTDPLVARQIEKLRENAEKYLKEPPLSDAESRAQRLNIARAVLGRILTWGMIYHIDGDERYAERAREELLNACAFTDWAPYQFLVTAEMGTAVGFGYDWFYNELSPEDRETIHQALMEKCLDYAPAAYGMPGQEKRPNWSAVGNTDIAHNNWNQVCNGGLLTAAFALQDEEPDMLELVVEGARKSLPRAMEYYGPDGIWPESPTYMSYGVMYNALCIALMEDQLGTDFGLSEMEGFDKNNEYLRYIFGPTGVAYTYGDGGPTKDAETGGGVMAAWLIKHFGYDEYISLYRERLADAQSKPLGRYSASLPVGAANRFAALLPLWMPEGDGQEEAGLLEELPLNVHKRGVADLVFLRSSWDDPDAVWVAMKAGLNGFAHAHLDLGSFVMEAEGVRWGVDLGSGKYSLPGYWDRVPGGKRWSYFRMTNLSHNTAGPGDQIQKEDATAPVIGFFDEPGFAAAVVDMSEVFPGTAEKILRGIALIDDQQVLVQDEWVQPSGKDPLVWRMMTSATVMLSNDKRSAQLIYDGKQLTARIVEPANATFDILSATPPTKQEHQNSGYRVLTATVPASTRDMTLAVLLVPGGGDGEEPEILPLEDWESYTD